MVSRAFKTKEFWTGVVYLAFATGAFLVARDYPLGSARAMGPGFFPSLVAGFLFLIGAIIAIRAFLVGGTPVEPLALRQIALVVLATLAFGYLIRTAGLVVALPVLILLGASASREFRLSPLPLLGMVVLTAFCALVFVTGLGVPMPLVGPWLVSLGLPALN